ncbi:MAG: TPM domain-containing protein, partial [Myxococcota bacterium]
MIAFAWASLALTVQAAPNVPALTGRVVDQANLLSPATERELGQDLADLESSTGAQFVVVTLPDLQGYPIDEFGYRMGREWGIGRAEQDDGVLLIVAKAERKVRIEVGYGLEGILTDAWSSHTIRRSIVPLFRQGDFDGGVRAGARAIIDQISADPETQQARLQNLRTQERNEDQVLFIIV